MHARSEWTTRVPNWSPARKGVPDVFIHHEGGAIRGTPRDKPAVLREIEAGVLGKGYIAIDYNVMVFNDGDVWAGRGLEHEDGATIHNNPTSVSICAVGNYEREPAPDALIQGIGQAVREAIAGGWTQPHPRVVPHRLVFSTACPGANLYVRMDDIRNAVGSPQEDDMSPDQINLMFSMLNDLKDRVGWVEAAVMPGGHDKRSPATAEQMRADITAIKKSTVK